MLMEKRLATRAIATALIGLFAWSADNTVHAAVINARPVAPLGDSDLQNLLANTQADTPPGIYVSGPVYDAVADQSAQAVFTHTASGGSIATFVIELTGASTTNRFGLYDFADPSKKVLLFDGAAGAGNFTIVSFLADGTVQVFFVDSGVTGFSGNFGFYVDVFEAAVGAGGDGDPTTLDYTVYTDDNLNPGLAPQALVYHGNDATTFGIPPLSPGVFTTIDWIIAFEDGLVGGPSGGVSDEDYSDLVVLMESITPPSGLCGDGVLDVGEECDDGPGNSDTTPGACRTDCTLAPDCPLDVVCAVLPVDQVGDSDSDSDSVSDADSADSDSGDSESGDSASDSDSDHNSDSATDSGSDSASDSDKDSDSGADSDADSDSGSDSDSDDDSDGEGGLVEVTFDAPDCADVSAVIDIGCDIIPVDNGQLVEVDCAGALDDADSDSAMDSDTDSDSDSATDSDKDSDSGSDSADGSDGDSESAQGSDSGDDSAKDSDSAEDSDSGSDSDSDSGDDSDSDVDGGACFFEFVGDVLVIRSDTAKLIVTATNAAGETASCMTDLCGANNVQDSDSDSEADTDSDSDSTSDSDSGSDSDSDG